MALNAKKQFADLADLAQWEMTPYQILVLGFATVILLGALLLMLPVSSQQQQSMGFIDALFTATSAVCVTGLVVVDTGTYFSTFGHSVIISLIQIGGLGIMTMATLMALVMRRKIQLRERLLIQESLNQLTMSGVVRLTKKIIFTTLLIEFIGGTILGLRWYQDFGLTGFYYGYWHAVSSFCNAGFDLFGNFNSLTAYVDDLTVNLVVTALIIVGGIGFTVMFEVGKFRSWTKFSLHTKVVLAVTSFLLLLSTLVIMLLEYYNPETLGELSLRTKLLSSYFQAVTIRTAGYNTLNIGALQDVTIFFMVIMMFIGASPSSTGGGIKTTTMGIMVSAIWALVRGRRDVEMFKRKIPSVLVYKAFAIYFISATLVILVTMMLSITEKVPFLKLLFEVVSAFATVGVSTGITPDLSPHAKLWLILTMFAGRVGPVTLALALAMKSEKVKIQYPDGKVSIG